MHKNGSKPYVPPPPEKLTYQADGLDVVLTIARANGSIGTYRTLLIERAKAEEAEADRDITDLRNLGTYLNHIFIYPSIMAATIDAKGLGEWPMPFEAYSLLPEPLMWQWEAKVFELNPHWRPVPPEEANAPQSEADQKKAPSSEPG